jgi:hypothetical protein
MPTRTTALARRSDTSELDRRIAAARDTAIVIWRGEPLPLMAVPERIARTPGRSERERLFLAWRDGIEALNPLLEQRFASWSATAAPPEGVEDVDLERFVLDSETPYYAALRRYLALIDIEQGDGTEADLWHVVRGTAWAHWFGPREVERGVRLAGRAQGGDRGYDGWRAAESALAGDEGTARSVGQAAVDAAYASIVGSPTWLREALGVVEAEVAALADFVAFVRLWQIRRLVGQVQYELRLFAPDARADASLARAYYAGMMGHITGVIVPEEAYLMDVEAPFASARATQATMLAAQVVETLEQRHGDSWWREPGVAATVDDIADAATTEDVLARLGYDAIDWRPVLRQIRTRLIGEMSGYGGPNITTRAGTRKV